MRLWTHAVGITIAAAGIVLLTVLPFLAGPYDPLALPLSAMCRVFGIVGLVLVPVGALWATCGYSNALARLRLLRSPTPQPTSAVAYYLLLVPLAVPIAQRALVAPAIESSRNRAIQNSAPLIAEIERHRAAQGRYPASLLSNHTDQYKPGVIGIEKYHYGPHEDAYNLIFEQGALYFGTQEFVVYNPRDRQVVTVHLQDLLRLTPEELALERRRGHYAVHDAGHPHWKYFWFD